MPEQRYWLMKSEPDEVSIDDALAAPNQTICWFGVRNYQARNFMRDQMQIGDGVLFYHSSCATPGIAGLAEIVSATYPDPTQFNPDSPYFDAKLSAKSSAKSSTETARWLALDVRAMRKTRLVTLQELRAEPALADLQLLARGNRLSVLPISQKHWDIILAKLSAT